MKLFESSYREGFESYIRHYDTDKEKSVSLKIPNEYEWFEPCSTGDYTYIYDTSMRMKKCTGSSKQSKEKYGIFNPIDRYVRDNYWGEKYNLSPRVWYLDIETRSTKGFPSPEKAQEEICLIQIYDNKSEILYVLGTRPFIERHDYTASYKFKYSLCNDEMQMLEVFLGIFKKLDPLIVYAWNGDNFDFPYIFNRLKNLGFKTSRLSNYGSVNLEQGTNFGQTTFDFSSHGHYFLDLMKVYKKFAFNQLPSYSLDSVSKSELNEGKIPHTEFLDFDSFYTGKHYKISDIAYDDPVREEIRQAKIKGISCDEQLQFRFVWYGMKDVLLMKRIDDKLNLTQILIGIAQEMGCSLDDAMRTVRPWSLGLQNLYYENKIVCPKKEEHDNPNVTGGYVREPVIGKHKWLMNFDVNSMYPMLSITGFNMSPELLIPLHDVATELREHVLKYFNSQDESKLLKYSDDIWNKTSLLLKKYNVSLTLNGCLFSHDRIGIIPQKVSEIYYGRKADKKKMIAYKKQAEIINEILESR